MMHQSQRGRAYPIRAVPFGKMRLLSRKPRVTAAVRTHQLYVRVRAQEADTIDHPRYVIYHTWSR